LIKNNGKRIKTSGRADPTKNLVHPAQWVLWTGPKEKCVGPGDPFRGLVYMLLFIYSYLFCLNICLLVELDSNIFFFYYIRTSSYNEQGNLTYTHFVSMSFNICSNWNRSLFYRITPFFNPYKFSYSFQYIPKLKMHFNREKAH